MILEARNVSLAYGTQAVVRQLELAVGHSAVTALIGANGSGKSTILRALARLLIPHRGAVYLDGRPIHEQPTREIAKRLAFLPQRGESPEGLTVYELVANGRYPYRAAFGGLSHNDRQAIESAIRTVALEALTDHPVEQLSGGERQRAFIAMALAQETEFLLLDEPTTFLDLRHQLEVLDLVRRLHRDAGKSVVMVLHDLNLAARYAERIVAIRGGAIVASGSPEEVIRPEVLKEIFDVEATVIRDPHSGTPHCVTYTA